MSPDTPDFETLLQEALGIRLAKVSQSTIKFSISKEFPNARVIRRTTVVSTIVKRGNLSNLPITEGVN